MFDGISDKSSPTRRKQTLSFKNQMSFKNSTKMSETLRNNLN